MCANPRTGLQRDEGYWWNREYRAARGSTVLGATGIPFGSVRSGSVCLVEGHGLGKGGCCEATATFDPTSAWGLCRLVAALGSGAEEEPGVSRMMEEHGVPTLVV